MPLMPFIPEEEKVIIEALKFTKEKISDYQSDWISKSHNILHPSIKQEIDEVNRKINLVFKYFESPIEILKSISEIKAFHDIIKSALYIYLQEYENANNYSFDSIKNESETIRKILNSARFAHSSNDLYQKYYLGYSDSQLKHLDSVKNDVFIIHGHDKIAVEKLKLIIIKAGQNPKFLKDYRSGSETLIQLLNKAKNSCHKVIVLLTPDDLGIKCSSVKKVKKNIRYTFDLNSIGGMDTLISSFIDSMKSRARQNVIFELGFFKAALGDENVTVLLKKNVKWEWDIPSDILGGFYLEYTKSIKERETEIINSIKK